jgi:peptide/nickel transport system permease protein
MVSRSKWQDFKTGIGPRIAEWRFMLRRLRQSTIGTVGVGIILFFIILAALAPVIAPAENRDPFNMPQDFEISIVRGQQPTPPTMRHIFGTTGKSFDIFYGCVWGTITAFRIGFLVVSISLVVGLTVGVVAGFYGGLLDEALMRFTDVIIAFPGLILSMALVLAFPSTIPLNLSAIALIVSLLAMFMFLTVRPGRRLILGSFLVLVASLFSMFFYPLGLSLSMTNLDKVLVSITIVGWPGYARVIRGEVLRVKNEDYIEASRASGSSDLRTIVTHILPNTIYPILIVATLDIGSIVLTAAALSFIGLGASETYADWGQIISGSRAWLSDPRTISLNYHTFLIPGLFITFFVVGWNLLGDALRDVLDPMLRRR